MHSSFAHPTTIVKLIAFIIFPHHLESDDSCSKTGWYFLVILTNFFLYVFVGIPNTIAAGTISPVFSPASEFSLAVIGCNFLFVAWLCNMVVVVSPWLWLKTWHNPFPPCSRAESGSYIAGISPISSLKLLSEFLQDLPYRGSTQSMKGLILLRQANAYSSAVSSPNIYLYL